MNKHKFASQVWLVVVGAALAALVLAATNAAASPSAQAPATAEALAVSPLVLHYQGRLLDPITRQPKPNGNYIMTFRLYNVETGGTALPWSETKNVFVNEGVFSTLLGDTTSLNLSDFNGQALWLGVTVESDPEATPRVALSPAPYAIGLMPGATISGSIPGFAGILRVNNSGQGAALVGLALSSTGQTFGVLGNAFSPGGTAVSGYAENSGIGISSFSGYGTTGYGVFGESWAGIGVAGKTTGGTYGLYTNQNLYVGGNCIGCTVAFVGQNGDTSPLEVGDVVSVSGIAPPLNGQQTPVLKVRRATATGGGVLGVVQARAVVTIMDTPVLNSKSDQTDIMEIPNITPGRVAPGEHLFVVVQGLVQVRVDAASGAIVAGDALAPSATAGVVQKVSLDSPTAPMLGRALEPIAKETGLIWVLVLGR